MINAKAQRMLNRLRHDIPRNPLRPIAIRQESVNHVQIKPGAVRADQKLSASRFDRSVRGDARNTIHHSILTTGGSLQHLAIILKERNAGSLDFAQDDSMKPNQSFPNCQLLNAALQNAIRRKEAGCHPSMYL